jgi:hypothetical protein
MQGTQPKAFVFVLMPFDEAFRDTDQLGIKPAGDVAGAYGERVDEQIFQESILERIFNQIAKADLIISDMTGRTPNVFYETGYAHALGKKVILLTQRSEDIPFDLKHYPHIIYGVSIVSLQIPCSLSRAHDRRSPFREALRATPSRGFTIPGEAGPLCSRASPGLDVFGVTLIIWHESGQRPWHAVRQRVDRF